MTEIINEKQHSKNPFEIESNAFKKKKHKNEIK